MPFETRASKLAPSPRLGSDRLQAIRFVHLQAALRALLRYATFLRRGIEITETTEDAHCFNSVISVTSVVKLALLHMWEVQLAGRMQCLKPSRALPVRTKERIKAAPPPILPHKPALNSLTTQSSKPITLIRSPIRIVDTSEHGRIHSRLKVIENTETGCDIIQPE